LRIVGAMTSDDHGIVGREPADDGAPPAGAKAPADLAAEGLAAANTAPEDRRPAWALGIKAVGGLLAVVVGVLALALIACVAFAAQDSTTTPVVTACVAGIGAVVGAYFGVKVGTDGTSTAIKAQQQASTNAQIAALYVSPEHAHKVAPHLTGGEATAPGADPAK
jgi:hypothetical protein